MALTCSPTTRTSQASGFRELLEGQKVEFDVTQGQKGPQAENIASALISHKLGFSPC